MSKNLFLDIETRSPLKIKNVGTYAYAEHAEILLLAYALDDQPVQCWDLTMTKSIPTDLKMMLNDSYVHCIAHNSYFERVCLKHCLSITIPSYRWKCTQVTSRLAGLPASLESVCQVLKLPEEYSKMDIEGKKQTYSSLLLWGLNQQEMNIGNCSKNIVGKTLRHVERFINVYLPF